MKKIFICLRKLTPIVQLFFFCSLDTEDTCPYWIWKIINRSRQNEVQNVSKNHTIFCVCKFSEVSSTTFPVGSVTDQFSMNLEEGYQNCPESQPTTLATDNAATDFGESSYMENDETENMRITCTETDLNNSTTVKWYHAIVLAQNPLNWPVVVGCRVDGQRL